jgi:hypothetical protein
VQKNALFRSDDVVEDRHRQIRSGYVRLSRIDCHRIKQNAEASDRDDPIQLDHDALTSLVSCIEVQRTQLVISLKPTDRSTEPVTLPIPWQKPPSKRFRKILMPGTPGRHPAGSR